MLAFEVYINGQKKFTAGGEDYQSLNALLGLSHLPLPKPDDTNITFMASAITSDQCRVGMWPTLDVAVGDRVEIRVVDVATVDAPESVQTLEKNDEADA
jgi:hypothetical protein